MCMLKDMKLDTFNFYVAGESLLVIQEHTEEYRKEKRVQRIVEFDMSFLVEFSLLKTRDDIKNSKNLSKPLTPVVTATLQLSIVRFSWKSSVALCENKLSGRMATKDVKGKKRRKRQDGKRVCTFLLLFLTGRKKR